jgi:ferritin-like protein
MLHLALVQNVLSAIGAAPHLTRPNLPAPAHHYPAGVNLTLVPFGERALQHFMFLERPEGMALEGAQGVDADVHEAVPLIADGDIVPQLQDFATIGHLYRSIEHGLPEHVASALGTVERALTAAGDSLARHFADWGATSRFATGGGVAPAIPTTDEPMRFEDDIKPLFRERDRDSMRFAFDLWSADDVSTHADAILARLEAGTMPCDGAWPAERVAVFRQWIDAGKPA